MELKDKLKKILKEQFGIETKEDLVEALNNEQPVDLEIFLIQPGGMKNEKTA